MSFSLSLISSAAIFSLMKRLETIIFDVSGVLLDDLYAVWKANSEAYEIHGFKRIESIEEFKGRFKMPIHEYHRSMGVPESIVPRIEAEYRQAYQKYDYSIKIFPEVKDTLQRLQRYKINLAVASNIPSAFLREHLKRFRIDKFFSVITGQDDCEEQKPSPKPILATLQKMKADPESAAYVGDMEEDIIAGKKAGVITIAVCRERSYHPFWRLRRRRPNFIISSLRDVIPLVDNKH